MDSDLPNQVISTAGAQRTYVRPEKLSRTSCDSDAATNAIGWRPADLGLSLTLSVVLAGSWLWWPAGRAVWDSVDRTIFRGLNGLLDIPITQHVWAYANTRYFDLLGVLAFGMLLTWVVREQRPQRKRACLSVGLLVLLALGLKGTANTVISLANSRLDRLSPSLVEPEARRLTHLLPEIKAKDASRWSFPGDHGILVLTVLIYLGYEAGPRTIHLGCLLAAVWTAPRLVSGAHWFSDIAVGSLTFALVGTALLLATPLHDWLIFKITGEGHTSSLRQRVGPANSG